MPRAISATSQAELLAQTSGEAFIALVTIDHADLAEPIRVCRDGVDTTSRGETYVAMPFELERPAEDDSGAGVARLSIQNVSQEITAAVRAMTTPPSVTIEIVAASDPDTPELTLEGFTLREARWDALVVEGTLDLEDFLGEAWPKDSFTPGNFPGIF